MYCSLETYRGLAAGFDVIGQVYANFKTNHDPYLDPLLGLLTEKAFVTYQGDEDVIGLIIRIRVIFRTSK